MITATPFLAAAADAKLEDWGPLEEATGEPMHTSGTTLWSGEGTQETGVWECTPEQRQSVTWKNGISHARTQWLRGIEPVPGHDDVRRRDG
jgi:uncharacterized cupin superfamily protein